MLAVQQMNFQLHHFQVETALLLAVAFFLGLVIGIPSRRLLRRSFGGGAPVLAGAGGLAVSDDGIVEVAPVAAPDDAGSAAKAEAADNGVAADVVAEIEDIVHSKAGEEGAGSAGAAEVAENPAAEGAGPASAPVAAVDDGGLDPVELAKAAVETDLAKAGTDTQAEPAAESMAVQEEAAPVEAAPPAETSPAGTGESAAEDGEEKEHTVGAEIEGADTGVLHSSPEDISARPRKKRRFLGWLLD